jgi:hypothetical protein
MNAPVAHVSKISTGRTTDLLANFDPSTLAPSTSIIPWIVPKAKYRGMLKFTGMKLEKQQLSKRHGLLLEIVVLICEYECTFDRWPGLPDYVNTTEKGAIFMPIKEMDGFTISTQQEREQFEAALQRAQQAIGPFYAFTETPLQPDARASNRLAPLGAFAVMPGMVDANGAPMAPGLHPNWEAILDYRMQADGPEGFPVMLSPSDGYLNPQCIDRASWAAHLAREAEARNANAHAAEGFTETIVSAPQQPMQAPPSAGSVGPDGVVTPNNDIPF